MIQQTDDAYLGFTYSDVLSFFYLSLAISLSTQALYKISFEARMILLPIE